ncbi:MAG: hypothetical protein H6662_04515 [Ardenticatenaceae bacterium]|nr:hypothetical protein [Ardenticatenaceae bacterium]MCB9002754.1 hypothetical protein [Ardenticatenaceae bacterium]
MKAFVRSFVIFIVVFLTVFLVGWYQAIASDPGDLDITFGTDGFVVTDFGDFDVAVDVETQIDGKIVVSGGMFGSPSNFAVARYHSDGSLDPTFGGSGIVTTTLSAVDYGRELALQSDGKIIVSGSSEVNGNKDFALVRYNSDGSLDSSFDGDGVVITSISGSADEIWGIALQSDGKIVVSGDSDGGVTIARYNSDGSLDASFGSGGIIAIPVGQGDGNAVRIQSDGKIVVAGQFAVIRLNADGSLDTTFDSDGIAMIPTGDEAVWAWDLCLLPDGRIMAVGFRYKTSVDYDIAAVRFNSDGSLDNTFGINGTIAFDLASTFAEGLAVARHSGNKVLIGGYDNGSPTIIRLNEDGSLDTTFSDDGIIMTNSASRWHGLTVQSNGKILAAGYGGAGNDFVTARFEGFLPELDEFIFLPVVVKP